MFDGLEALFASLAEQHPLRTEVANSLAWFLLMTERRDVLVRAESLSRYAVAHTPQAPHCQGTLGSILVEQSRTGEGRPLLEAALRGNTRAGKALKACYLARADLLDGEIDRARAYLDRARRLDPKCGLLAPTEERLTAAIRAQPQG